MAFGQAFHVQLWLETLQAAKAGAWGMCTLLGQCVALC